MAKRMAVVVVVAALLCYGLLVAPVSPVEGSIGKLIDHLKPGSCSPPVPPPSDPTAPAPYASDPGYSEPSPPISMSPPSGYAPPAPVDPTPPVYASPPGPAAEGC